MGKGRNKNVKVEPKTMLWSEIDEGVKNTMDVLTPEEIEEIAKEAEEIQGIGAIVVNGEIIEDEREKRVKK